MTALSFRVVGVASGMGSKRAFIPSGWKTAVITDSNRNLKSWQSLIANAAGQAISARGEPWRLLDGPVRVSVAFYLPRPMSLPKKVVAMTKAVDLDKLCRALFDSLSGVVYRDDALVCELVAGKYYAAAQDVPHVDVTVEPTLGLRPAEIVRPAPSSLFLEALYEPGGAA